MRLTCPNCGAQYEVPADVLPKEGRDVQCSNCGKTWFQEHPDNITSENGDTTQPAQEDEEVVRVDPATEPPRTPEYEEEMGNDPVPSAHEQANRQADDGAEDAIGQGDGPAPVRRELDPSVANVLRAEAELEEKARRRESGSVESQPDLGLVETSDETSKRERETLDRMARIRGEKTSPDEPDPAMPDVAAAGSRRDLLPDIEEINSTLRSNSDRSPDGDPGQTAQYEVQEKRSSRRGFIVTVALVVLLALVYAYAPQLAESVPSAEGALSAYVSFIDEWRLWLDAQVSSVLNWFGGTSAPSAE